MLRQQAVKTGRIGEFLAAAIVETYGWQTAMCQQSGVDMIMWESDRFYRVQVKSSNIQKGTGKLQFHFGLGANKRKPTDEYDLAVCVSIYHRRAFFLPICDVNTVTLAKPPEFFEDLKTEAETFHATMEHLLTHE